MPFDTSIFRPAQLPDPLESYGRVMGIMGALDEQKLRNLQMQRVQQQMDDDKAARGITPETSDADLFHAVGPDKAIAIIKARHEAQRASIEKDKSQLELAAQRTKRLGELAGGIHDDASQHAVTLQALQEKLIDPDHAAQLLTSPYDPKAVDQFRVQALSAEQAYAKQRADKELEFKALDEAHKAKMRPFEEQQAQQNAIIAQQKATGTEPIQPKDQAQIEATKAAHEDTKRHQQVLEQQGAQRVALEGQRVGMERQKFSMDQGALQRTAQSLATGDMTRLRDIASLRGDQRIVLYDMAKQINPNFNPAEVDRKIKMEDAFVNGKEGQNIQSFGTFLQHAGAASDLVNSVRQTGSPAINKPLNWWRKNMAGSPEYQSLISSLEPVRKEAETFLLNNHALQSDDRKAANTILDDNASPAQLQAALKQLGHTAEARFKEMNYRYKRTMGHDIQDPFSPEAQAGAAKIGVNLGGQPQSGGTTAVKTWNPKTQRFE